VSALFSNRTARVFVLVWIGQLVSLTGSGLTGFILGIWAYQRTGSVQVFALTALAGTLPTLLLSPLAGVLVDRRDRRLVMLLSDIGSAAVTLAIALLFFAGSLELWQIYAATALNAACRAFHWPAYSAATTLLVPKEQLGRANGLVQMSQALGQIIAPALAGALLQLSSLGVILAIDLATFLAAVVTLLLVRFPPPPAAQSPARPALLREATAGWRYIAGSPGLLALLGLFAASNLIIGVVSILMPPLVLSFTSAAAFGSILSVAGLGMLAGSLAMSAWGGPGRRVPTMLGCMLIGSLSVIFAGLLPQVAVFAVAIFCFAFTIPIVNGSNQAIWQARVAPELQGRVFAACQMIAMSATPLAQVAAGPLADSVFTPLLLPGGALAGSVGRVIGVGPGYGIALLFIVLGALNLAVVVAALLYPRLRRLEDEAGDSAGSAAPDDSLSVSGLL
jgi:MFS family permease